MVINNKDKIIKRRKRKKKKINIKQKLAIRKYIDPKSDTFLNKYKTLNIMEWFTFMILLKLP